MPNENQDVEPSSLEETRETIKIERDLCNKINLELLSQCKEHKKILDMRYDDIYKYLTYIQTSIIISSTISSFVQALGSNIHVSERVEFILSLLVTTYISLILSLAKFFKLEEKKEGIHNLREKFAELHNKIRYRIDNLKPWGSLDFINSNDCIDKYKHWKEEKNNTYNDYYKIIQDKQSLFMEFEKLVDSRLKNIYLRRLNRQLKEKEKIKKVTTNLEHLIKEDMDNSGNNKYDVNKTPRNEIFSLEHINHLSTNVEANDSSEENV